MTDKRPISEHFILKFQNTEKDSKCSGKKRVCIQRSEWHQISQKRYWKLEDNGAMPSQFWRKMTSNWEFFYLANYESNVRRREKRIIFRHLTLSIYFTSHTAFLRSYQKIMPPKQKKIQEMGILHRRGEKYFQDSYVAGQWSEVGGLSPRWKMK